MYCVQYLVESYVHTTIILGCAAAWDMCTTYVYIRTKYYKMCTVLWRREEEEESLKKLSIQSYIAEAIHFDPHKKRAE